VLLIGIVGAFFFRNDREHLADVPQLEDPQELDRIIDEKPYTPYPTGIEELASGDLDAGRGSVQKRGFHYDLPDFLKDEPENVKDHEQPPRDYKRSVSIIAEAFDLPDPIRIPNEFSDEKKVVRIPDHNNAWDVKLAKKPRRTKKQSTPTQFTSLAQPSKKHVVQKGETLSGIAARYLGSSSKFRKIYEANRDRLKSPDDLKVGMTIIIPQESARANPSQKQGAAVSGVKSRAAGKFSATRRSPFRPKKP